MAVPGPFSSKHFYVQWGGKLPGNEEWSCGFRMLNTTAHATSDGPQLLVGIGAALATFHGNGSSQIHASAKLSYVKVNSIEIDGKYSLDTTNEATYGDLPGNGLASPLYPNQVAWCVSLTTGFSRGTAHRGRFYLPLPAVAVTATGAISPSFGTALKTPLATLRTSVNSAVPGYVMAVMSRKASGPGHRAVTGFEVGTVLDTQRRRRRSVVEQYM